MSELSFLALSWIDWHEVEWVDKLYTLFLLDSNGRWERVLSPLEQLLHMQVQNSFNRFILLCCDFKDDHIGSILQVSDSLEISWQGFNQLNFSLCLCGWDCGFDIDKVIPVRLGHHIVVSSSIILRLRSELYITCYLHNSGLLKVELTLYVLVVGTTVIQIFAAYCIKRQVQEEEGA